MIIKKIILCGYVIKEYKEIYKIHKIKQRIKNIKIEQGKSLSPHNHVMLEIEKINLEYDLFTIKNKLGAKYVKQNIFNR